MCSAPITYAQIHCKRCWKTMLSARGDSETLIAHICRHPTVWNAVVGTRWFEKVDLLRTRRLWKRKCAHNPAPYDFETWLSARGGLKKLFFADVFSLRGDLQTGFMHSQTFEHGASCTRRLRKLAFRIGLDCFSVARPGYYSLGVWKPIFRHAAIRKMSFSRHAGEFNRLSHHVRCVYLQIRSTLLEHNTVRVRHATIWANSCTCDAAITQDLSMFVLCVKHKTPWVSDSSDLRVSCPAGRC